MVQQRKKKIKYHLGDIDEKDIQPGDVAIDTEAMGLQVVRDRICLVQLCFKSDPDTVHLVHFPDKVHPHPEAPNLKEMLLDDSRTKVFHFARFDLALLQFTFEIWIKNVYCTKTASRICRTYTERHGLRDLCYELLGTRISKEQQSSDWGKKELSQAQMDYASNDVFYLHQLREILDGLLEREKHTDIAKQCFEFLSTRAMMDILGWSNEFFDY